MTENNITIINLEESASKDHMQRTATSFAYILEEIERGADGKKTIVEHFAIVNTVDEDKAHRAVTENFPKAHIADVKKRGQLTKLKNEIWFQYCEYVGDPVEETLDLDEYLARHARKPRKKS